MATFNPPETAGSSIKYQHSNGSIPAGNKIDSNIIANPETLFASTDSIPASVFSTGTIVRIYAAGVYGSGVVSLPLTVKIKSGSNTLASCSFTPALNLANKGWEIDLYCNIFDLSTVEIQGRGIFAGVGSASSVMAIGNSSTFAVNMSNDVPISCSAQWGALAIGGTIQLRILSIIVT